MGGGGFLGLGPAPSAPAAPDYTGAAQATAAGNVQAAQTATAANRVNQVTPYGNLNYAETGTDSQGNPTWTATTSLSDVGQQLLNNQNNASLGLGSAISSQLGQVQNVMGQGFNPQTGPITTNAGQANLNQLYGNANLSQVGQGPQFNQAGTAQQAQGIGQAQNLQTNPNYASGMQGWDQANQILQARLQPQMAQAAESNTAALANQGIVPGTQAYENAMRTFNQGQNDLLTNSQLAGQSIGNNLFNQGLAGGQFTNSAITQQNQNQLANTSLNNSAAQQNYTNQLAGLGFNNQQAQQGYANTLAAQQANNAASQQGYANSQQQQQANNAIAQQQFGNQMANANLGNTAQQQQYNQALTNYNMPLNTLSALRTGAQVQNPTFVNAPQQANTSGADLLGATQMGYNAQMGNFNAQQAAQQGLNSGLMGLGGTLGAAAIISDIRTKENIEQVGKLANGLNVYTYEYKPEFRDDPFAGHGKHFGVMAQEVEEIMPEAVITRPDGYKMVDYAKL
jgi:hypothetical protein